MRLAFLVSSWLAVGRMTIELSFMDFFSLKKKAQKVFFLFWKRLVNATLYLSVAEDLSPLSVSSIIERPRRGGKAPAARHTWLIYVCNRNESMFSMSPLISPVSPSASPVMWQTPRPCVSRTAGGTVWVHIKHHEERISRPHKRPNFVQTNIIGVIRFKI